jgi:hypothetical protein
MTDNAMVEDAVRLSAMVMQAAEPSDPAGTGQRIVDLAARLIPCAAVDIVRPRTGAAMQVTASTDRAISDLLGAALLRWPHDRYPEVDAATAPSVAKPPAGYLSQVRDHWPWRRVDLPLPVDLTAFGYLRFLLRDPIPPTSTAGRLGAAFAAHAAIVLDRAALQEAVGNLLTAIVGNREIGAAVGIPMARGGISYDAAFALLKTTSHNNNRLLRDVVSDVLYTGQLPNTGSPRAAACRRGAAA